MNRSSFHRFYSLVMLFAGAIGCSDTKVPVPPTNDTEPDVEVLDGSRDLDASSDVRDAEDTRDSEPDADMGVEVLPDVWDEVTNRCATAHPVPTPSELGEDQARPDQVLASLAWGRSEPCEEMQSPQGVDRVGLLGSMALVERGGKEVVVVTHELLSVPQWAGDGVKALAWVDPSDGSPLECDPYPDGRGVVLPPIHSNPWTPDNVIVATSSYQNDVTSELPNEPPSTIWWGPEWPQEDGNRTLPDPIDDIGATAPQTKLLPDGQLLLFPRRDRVVSVDAVTGELNWVVRPSDIQAALGDVFQGSFNMSRHSMVFDAERRVLRTRVVAADGRTLMESIDIEIDACGEVTLVEAEATDESMWRSVPFGEGVLEIGLDGRMYKARVRDGDQTLASLAECAQLVTLNKDTVGCWRTSKFGAAFELEKLTWPARKSIVRLDESNSSEAEIVLFYNTPVALQGGVLLLSATYSSATEGSQRIIFFDWHAGEVLTHVEYTIPADAVARGFSGPPVVTTDGTVVVQSGGYLTGIDTNLNGLAPTLFPRGMDLGRNDNLGIWAP